MIFVIKGWCNIPCTHPFQLKFFFNYDLRFNNFNIKKFFSLKFKSNLSLLVNYITFIIYKGDYLLLASYVLWISPGKTCPSSMLKLSYCPKTLVGMTDVYLQPCWAL